MTEDKSRDILNDVLATLIDSADGYEKAAEIAERPTVENFFSRRATSRRQMASAVREEISKLGGPSEKDGTLLASAHRVFMGLSAALQDNDEAAIKAVDQGEDHLLQKFESALASDELNGSAKTLLRNYQGEVRADGRLIDHLEEATA